MFKFSIVYSTGILETNCPICNFYRATATQSYIYKQESWEKVIVDCTCGVVYSKHYNRGETDDCTSTP